jgi:hypothetical protein
MHVLLVVLGLLAAGTAPASDLGRWADRVADCVRTDLAVWTADAEAGLVAFACGAGDRRLVVMANAGDAPQRVMRADRAPLVPVYSTDGDPGAIPSLLVTLFDAGGVAFSNAIPAHTAVVFRPAEQADVRPRGLHE